MQEIILFNHMFILCNICDMAKRRKQKQELTIRVNQIDFGLQNLALSRCKGIFVTVVEEIFSTFIFFFSRKQE